MAGHSKWANIQHRKKAQDAKRGKLFTKLIREITVASKIGGPQSESNPRLRLAVDKALEANVTKSSIERAIKRASGENKDSDYQELVYEGYASGGVAVLVECMTDNKNRTAAEIRHIFSRYNGKLGTTGSVAYLFKKKGVLIYPKDRSEDEIWQIALQADVEDLITAEDSFQILTEPQDMFNVRTALENKGLHAKGCEYQMYPSDSIEVDAQSADKIINLLESLDEADDVQNVFCNADFPAETEHYL